MNLRSKAFSASRWTSASTFLATGLQILQTVVLARLLMPADFGLMAVAAAVIAVLSLVVDLGLSQALIHFDDVTQEHRSSLYWLNMMLAMALMLLLVAIGPVFGRWYDSPALGSLLQWVAPVFPLSAVGQQLRALGARELRFNILATNDIMAAVAGLASAVGAAALDAGVYALVIGLLAKASVDSVLAWLRFPASFRPGLHFRLLETSRYLGFGSYLVGESLVNVLNREADVFLGGLVVGPGPIGLYSIPRDLSLRGARALNSAVTKVGFPVMSRVKREPEKLKSIYLQTLRMTASVNFPLYVALGLFASEIVNLLYGSHWRGAIPYLRILAVWGLVRSVGNPVGSLIYASGRTRRAFWWNVVLLLIFPPVLWLGTGMFGLLGLATAMLALQLATVVPGWYFLVRPCCGARLAEYLTQFAAPILCAGATGIVAWLATHDLPHGTLRLAIGGVVGGVVYVALSWFFNRRWLLAMHELLRLPLPRWR